MGLWRKSKRNYEERGGSGVRKETDTGREVEIEEATTTGLKEGDDERNAMIENGRKDKDNEKKKNFVLQFRNRIIYLLHYGINPTPQSPTPQPPKTGILPPIITHNPSVFMTPHTYTHYAQKKHSTAKKVELFEVIMEGDNRARAQDVAGGLRILYFGLS